MSEPASDYSAGHQRWATVCNRVQKIMPSVPGVGLRSVSQCEILLHSRTKGLSTAGGCQYPASTNTSRTLRCVSLGQWERRDADTHAQPEREREGETDSTPHSTPYLEGLLGESNGTCLVFIRAAAKNRSQKCESCATSILQSSL